MIFKYNLGTYDLPLGSKTLTAQYQNGEIRVWVDVPTNTDSVKERRTFTYVGTGFEPPTNSKYIATVQEPPFVWHIYEH